MLKELDSKTYLVITSCYYNRPNNPPMPVFIQKLEEKTAVAFMVLDWYNVSIQRVFKFLFRK